MQTDAGGFNHVCLVIALQALGAPIVPTEHGPLRAFRDGNRLLQGSGSPLKCRYRVLPGAADLVLIHDLNDMFGTMSNDCWLVQHGCHCVSCFV